MTNEQARQRDENLEALVRLGIDPSPYRYETTHHTSDVLADFDRLSASKEVVENPQTPEPDMATVKLG